MQMVSIVRTVCPVDVTVEGVLLDDLRRRRRSLIHWRKEDRLLVKKGSKEEGKKKKRPRTKCVLSHKRGQGGRKFGSSFQLGRKVIHSVSHMSLPLAKKSFISRSSQPLTGAF